MPEEEEIKILEEEEEKEKLTIEEVRKEASASNRNHTHTGKESPKIRSKDLIFSQGGHIEGSKVRAYRDTSGQTIGSTPEQIDLQAESFDNRGEYDTSTYRFTANKEGYYFTYAQIYYQSVGDNETVTTRIYKNGSENSQGRNVRSEGTGNKDIIVNVTDLIKLNKDDYIELYGSASTSRTALNGEANTYMTIFRIL